MSDCADVLIIITFSLYNRQARKNKTPPPFFWLINDNMFDVVFFLFERLKYQNVLKRILLSKVTFCFWCRCIRTTVETMLYLSIYYGMPETSKDPKHPPLRQSRSHSIECSQDWLLARHRAMIYVCAGGSSYCQRPYVLMTENPSQKSLIIVPVLIDHNLPLYF